MCLVAQRKGMVIVMKDKTKKGLIWFAFIVLACLISQLIRKPFYNALINSLKYEIYNDSTRAMVCGIIYGICVSIYYGIFGFAIPRAIIRKRFGVSNDEKYELKSNADSITNSESASKEENVTRFPVEKATFGEIAIAVVCVLLIFLLSYLAYRNVVNGIW